MAQSEPSSDPENAEATQKKPPSPNPSRVSGAWSVLRGQRLVPLQIQFEWLEYQQVFDDLLTRFGAQLARQAKARGKAIKKQLQPPGEVPELPYGDLKDRKSKLRQRIFGGSPPSSQPNGELQPEEESP